MIHKSYKFRLYPNKAQEAVLQNHFGACRFVYNHFLELKIKSYKETKKNLTWVDLANELPKMKQQNETSWLKEVSSVALQQSIIHLDKAYTNFFKSGNGFPKFKSKKFSRKSYTVLNPISIDYDSNRLTIPKFQKTKTCDNRLKCIFSRDIEGIIKQATISQDSDGRYYVSILCEIDKELPTKQKPDRNKAIGLDFGIKTFLTFDNGTKIENPLFLKRSLNKLKKHQQELAALDKESTRYKSKKEQITRLYSKITRQRKDFLDKLTYKLTHESQVDTICLEDLSIKEMQTQNNSNTNRKISDLTWNMFVQMLQYKCDWYGKNLIKIGRFDPSSKTCSECGYIKHDLTLDDREWECPICHTKHDRDINAARNIKDFAIPDVNFKRLGTSLSNPNHL